MRRLAPAALLHINLMLALYAGAGLATAARLKWDPTTYIAVRELFPAEYRAAAAVLCAASAALLALAHLGAAPPCLPARRARAARALYLAYAGGMCALLALEVAWVVWTARSLAAWLASDPAAQMMELAELRVHLQPILQILGKYHPLPERIGALVAEAEADAPRNLYVAGGAALLLAVLQPAAVLAALLAARALAPAAPPAPRTPSPSPPPRFDAHDAWSYSRSDSEAAPLKAKYKAGRLVMV